MIEMRDHCRVGNRDVKSWQIIRYPAVLSALFRKTPMPMIVEDKQGIRSSRLFQLINPHQSHGAHRQDRDEFFRNILSGFCYRKRCKSERSALPFAPDSR